MKIRFVGDIHGNINKLLELVEKNKYDKIVQVGDFGIGFIPEDTMELCKPIFKKENIFWIRGNHDSPELCKLQPNYIPDGHCEEGIFYMGGADSIDKMYRTPGLNWWYDEQLSHQELERMVHIYKDYKPDIVVTHEVPEFVTKFFNVPIFNISGDVTRPQLEEMWHSHKPKLWIAGHWHFKFDQIIDGTRFLVLDINQFIDIDIYGDCLTEQPLYKII